MPRKARSESNLRKLREITGLTQPDFARLCGINPGTYQNLELGRHRLLVEMSSRIQWATGCKITHKSSEGTITLKDWSGRDYTQESFNKWRELGGNKDESLIEERKDFSAGVVKSLIDAAHMEGRGVEVTAELLGDLIDLVDRYDLHESMIKVLGLDGDGDLIRSFIHRRERELTPDRMDAEMNLARIEPEELMYFLARHKLPTKPLEEPPPRP